MRKLLSLIALTLLLAACGQSTPSAAPTAAVPQPTEAAVATLPPSPTANTSPTLPPASPYPGPSDGAPPAPYPVPSQPSGTTQAPAELVSAVRDRLAQQVGIDAAKLQLLRSEAQQWPDGSLGCPEPGKAYDQYAIPGYLLAFSDGAREYAVHTSLAANPGEPMIFCDNKKPVDLSTTATPPVLSPEAQAMADLVKQSLAKTLGIDPATITIVSVVPVEWNDSSLGCPKPDQSYLQVITPGYLVRLEAAGKGYEYHTDSRNQVVQCTP